MYGIECLKWNVDYFRGDFFVNSTVITGNYDFFRLYNDLNDGYSVTMGST